MGEVHVVVTTQHVVVVVAKGIAMESQSSCLWRWPRVAGAGGTEACLWPDDYGG